MKNFWIGIFIAIISTGQVFAQADAKVGETKAAMCVACHGPGGNSSNSAWPKLAGQNAKYLVKQMQEFKKGKQGNRYNATMNGMSAGLSEDDMKNLAAYFSSQKLVVGKTEQKYLALGQALYRGGNLDKGIPACAACHGAQGQGNAEAAYPALSGQYAEYTLSQLTAYKTDQRVSVANIMNDIAKKMSDEEMKAVANYIVGLH